MLALKYVSDRKIEPLCRPQQEMSKKSFSVARCLLALDVQKSKNFCSENDTSLSHLQEVHKAINRSPSGKRSILNTIHLSFPPRAPLLKPTQSVMATSDYATGVMRVLTRVGGETRETREGKNIFVFRLFFFFSPLACIACCDADSN